MLSFALSAVASLAFLIGTWPSPAAAQQHAGAEARRSTLPGHAPRLDRARPVIAVVAHNALTEVTDYVVPYGILAESGVAEVIALAIASGPVQMSPALRFEAQATTRQFEQRYPGGADYVIVPNVYDGQHDAALLDWIKRQAARGAVIVGICDGVPVLANAGLLEGRRATAHWKTIDGLERRHARTQWLRNQRYVADGNVITTSGVSASIPISVALVEAIAGPERAAQVASSLGVRDWSPVHDSSRFRLDAASLFTVLRNKAMFWGHETLGVPVAPGVDEIAVALLADAYARTRRTTAVSISASDAPIRTRRGLTLLPDRVSSAAGKATELLSLREELPAVQALDRALAGIAARYGEPTAAFVALTMEYRRP